MLKSAVWSRDIDGTRRYDRRMLSPRALWAGAVAGLSLLTPALVLAAVSKPPPPPDFSSGIERSRLVAGRLATFTYAVESTDAFTLTLTQQRSALVVLRAGSSPYRLVSSRPTWTVSLAGDELTTRTVRIRVRLGSAWAGRTVCLKVQERLTYGGVPDVFEQKSCGTVERS